MTQAHLDSVNFSISCDEFQQVQCKLREQKVLCSLTDNVSLVIRKEKSDIIVSIQKGGNKINLPLDLFKKLCESHLTVLTLAAYLEGHSYE